MHGIISKRLVTHKSADDSVNTLIDWGVRASLKRWNVPPCMEHNAGNVAQPAADEKLEVSGFCKKK